MKISKLLAAGVLALSLAACSSADTKTETEADATENTETTVLTIGATTSPHALILEQAKTLLADQGVELDIVEFSDYPNINPSTSDGSLDANYFQTKPYLDSYNADNGYSEGSEGYLLTVGAIHYEPLGIYSQTHETLEPVEGATVVIPNDVSNEARALFLLQDQGWITLSEDASIADATVSDIAENPYNLEIVEISSDQVASKLPDIDYGIINGNYALSSGVTDYLLVTEAQDSEAANRYQNYIVVEQSNADNEAVKKLVEVLRSDEIKEYIVEEFGAFAVPAV
jgi:D-methionine transport system substrate-binding protein